MKNKLQKGMAILLAILLLITVVTPVKAYEIGEYAQLDNYGYQACMSKNGMNLQIEQMMYQNGAKNYPSYYYTAPQTVTYQNRKAIRQGKLADDNLRGIILAGYPYHSYQELGCYSEYPAYLATQLCILEYTQSENLSQYQACDNTGNQVETAIQRIKENMANRSQPGQTPVFEVVTDREWEEYPYDPSKIVKTVHIQCEGYYPGTFSIQAEDSQVEILNEANYPSDRFYPDQTWKIRLPKTVQETGIELCLTITTSCDTDAMWLASSTENGEMFIITQDREETIQNTYCEKIEQPKEPEPEQPNEKDNLGEDKKDPPKEDPPKEPEEIQKPEEKPSNSQTTPGDTNQNENQNQNNQQTNVIVQPNIPIQNTTNVVVQPNIPIQNTIKQKNNATFQVSINPETILKQEQQTEIETAPKEEPKIIQPKISTSANKKVITASQIKVKKLPRTGY